MFGLDDDVLLENLETLRSSLCCYRGPTCDCKFGASRKGEQTGCPEIRQAIAYIAGQRDEVATTRDLFEQSAVKTLAKIKALL